LHRKAKSAAPRNLIIVVTALLGATLGIQALAVSTDATLTSLTPSVGTLVKASDNSNNFLASQLLYKVVVPKATTTFSLSAVPSDSGATMEVSFANGSYSSMTSGALTSDYNLAAGVNLFKVKVTASDSATTKIYELRVFQDLNPNSNFLQISFTGMTALPSNLYLLGANSLEVAWTQGADLTGATWININNSTSTSLASIPVPTLSAGTVTAGQTWIMTIRGEVLEASTRTSPDLYGFIGASSSSVTSTAVAGGSQYMKEVLSLGTFSNFSSLKNAFYGSTSQLLISCKLPGTVRFLTATFSASTFNDYGIASWDVSLVTNFVQTFYQASIFNQDLSAWYTGSATSMADMFFSASSFNQPIGTWNTANVTNMAQMFRDDTVFNQNISSWNVSKVSLFTSMFYRLSGPQAFNNGMSPGASGALPWNTVSATDMSSMFFGAVSFNQDVSTWNTSKVTTMQNMFRGAATFNQAIGAWNTGAVTNFAAMFLGAAQFNQPLNDWDTSRVTATYDMFNGASAFNQPLDKWNTLIVTNMANMFRGAIVFNQNLNTWDISQVTDISNMFNGASAFNNGSTAGVAGFMTWTMGSKLVNASGTFLDASSFNQDMSTWNVNALTNARQFVTSTTSSFNQSLAFLNIGNYGGTTLANNSAVLVSFPSATSPANVVNTIESWGNRTFTRTSPMSTFKFLIVLSGQQVPYNNCRSYSLYLNTLAWATYSGGATGSMTVPSGCGAAPSVTWTPTGTPLDVTVSNSVYRFTPDAMPAASGYAGDFSYLVSNTALNGNCSVSPSGEVSFTIPGSTCAIKAYTTDPNTNVGSATVTFNVSMAPGAPTITSFTILSGERLSVSYTGSAPNGSTILRYEYSTDGGQTWLNQFSPFTNSVAPSTLLLMAESSSGNPNFTVGTQYNVKIRAANSTLAGPASNTVVMYTEVKPAAPTISSVAPGDRSISVSFTAGVNTGSAIQKYQYSTDAGSTWLDATGTTSPIIVDRVSATGIQISNGTAYTVRLRAVNYMTSNSSNVSASVTPALLTVPGAPTLGTPVSGNSRITVSWTAPASNGGSAITGYTATTSVGGFTCTTTNLTCDITGLTNGTSYTVSVKATNAVGDSVSSGTYSIKPEVLPGAPTITSIVAGDKQLFVYFTAPTSNGGSAITQYRYTTNSAVGTVLVNSTSSPITVNLATTNGLALANGTSYSVQLAAINSGLGDWSTAQSGTPNVLPEAPTSVTGLIGGGKVTVSWTASAGNAGTSVTGYTVTSTPGSFTCTTTGATTCDVTGLTNGVAYTFSVVATNAMGNSVASASSGALKPDVAPGAPTGISVARGDGSLTLNFTAGTNTGSAIVKYQYSNDGTAWNDFATNSNATSQTISGLTNGTSYSVYLRAVNTLFGTASSSVSASPRAAPGAPVSFAVTAGYTQISVSWNLFTSGGGGVGMPGTNGGETITKYQYQLDGGAWVDFAGTTSPQVISGLTNAVSYSVKIRAFSDIAGVATSALSATPVKLAQTALVLGIAETVAWTSNNTVATLTYSVYGSLTLQTTGGSGTGSVIYTLTGGSDCSVVNSTLLIPDVGQPCEVTATKVSDGDYSSTDSQTISVVTTPASQVSLVWKSQTSTIFGQSFDVSYGGGSGSGATTVSSSDTSVCTVTGTRINTVGAGTCLITVTKGSSTNYQVASVSQSINVAQATQNVSFTSQVPATPIAGDDYNLTASATSGATPTFARVSGDCTVSGSTVNFTASGPCVIRASATRTNYFDASTTQTINVGQRNQTLSFATAIRNLVSKTYGAPAFFADASTSEATLTPTYALGSGTTNSACSVSTNGIVQLLAAGECEIDVTQAGDSAVAAASPISKSFTVLPDQASKPEVTSVSAGHQSITAAFIKPSYSGGSPITAYRVDAVFAGGVESTSACPVVAGEAQTCTISGLENGTSYQIKVAAITLAGAGIFSDLAAARVPATNPAAVSAFTAVPNNTTIVLSWNDPISLGGGTFDSYRIFYKRASVANYPSSYINVQSQSPTNYTITGLINGEAYDVKIVTVTTANTASLVSNTAEVKETPRTVPDAPATVDVLEVAGNLVITWSAPQSDGGNAVSEYRVTVNGSACTLANALDNLCSIPVPTSSGTYPIEVKAKNDAGYSSPAIATFTKAGVPSSGSSGGAAGGSESAPSDSKSIEIISVNVKNVTTLGGAVVSVTGKNFAGVTTVLVDGIKAKIISVTSGLIKFVAPRNTNGPATLELKSSIASAELVDALIYTNGNVKSGVQWVYKYVQSKTLLSTKAKQDLRNGLNINTGTVAITCVGYQSYSYNTAKDKATAIGRAKQACNYLKSINPKLSVKTVIARTNLTGPASRKLAVQYRTSK
jgi:surface protein